MAASAISFEKMSPKHLHGALDLSAQAGWPHKKTDWEMSLTISEGIVGLENGRVIATVLMTPYGKDGATLNLVIVDESMRGQGLGRRLMAEALALAGDRTLHLIATQEGVPLYEKLGFVAHSEIIQCQVPAIQTAAPENVTPATSGEFDQIISLDRNAYGHDRSDLMHSMRTLAKFFVIREDGTVQAFAAVRDFGRGKVLGPVVARKQDEAKALINSILSRNTGQFVRIDTDATTGLAPWLEPRGLMHAGTGVAMVRSGELLIEVAQRSHWIFALASQAFG